MIRRSIKNIQLNDLEGRDIIFRNFSGAPDRYNRKGGRHTFCVRIRDEQFAQSLNDEGWNVKVKPPRDEDDSSMYYLPVEISFERYPAQVYQHCGRVMTQLNEDNIAILDNCDILGGDILIRPYEYEDDSGANRIKAYVKIFHVVVEQDPFASKYAAEESPEEDVPWR